MSSQSLKELRNAMLLEAEKHKKLAADFEEFAKHVSELIRQIESLENSAVTFSNVYDEFFDEYFFMRAHKSLWKDDFWKSKMYSRLEF